MFRSNRGLVRGDLIFGLALLGVVASVLFARTLDPQPRWNQPRQVAQTEPSAELLEEPLPQPFVPPNPAPATVPNPVQATVPEPPRSTEPPARKQAAVPPVVAPVPNPNTNAQSTPEGGSRTESPRSAAGDTRPETRPDNRPKASENRSPRPDGKTGTNPKASSEPRRLENPHVPPEATTDVFPDGYLREQRSEPRLQPLPLGDPRSSDSRNGHAQNVNRRINESRDPTRQSIDDHESRAVVSVKAYDQVREDSAVAQAKPLHPYFERYRQEGEFHVREGDTLENIAHRLYGGREHADTLLRANSHQLQHPDDLRPGMKLRLP